MHEKEWVTQAIGSLVPVLAVRDPTLGIAQGTSLVYAREVRSYHGVEPSPGEALKYETDILISERVSGTDWKPRVVLEAKVGTATTHEAITYSEKALSHKRVHPYLRYGIFLGNRRHYPLPGRLYRHGAYFDFMVSWVSYAPSDDELAALADLIIDEVRCSRLLEEILYSSRSPNRQRYTILQKPLVLR